MRIIFFSRIQTKVYLAFSGGVDSTVLLYLLLSKKLPVSLLFIHHREKFCDTELRFAEQISKLYNLELVIRYIDPWPKTGSKECYWSQERNKIFQSMSHPVLTGHHLDDAVEWYVMSTFQGTPKILDYQNRNVLRPLICTPKSQIYEFAKRQNIKYLTDPSNSNPESGLRSKTRTVLMEKTFECFPGLRTTVARLIRNKEMKKKLNEQDEI